MPSFANSESYAFYINSRVLCSDKVEIGFKTYFYFITTQDPTINIKRIGFRVSKGGHNVSEEKIIERYYRTMDLLYNAFVIADTAFIFDNSSEDDRSLLIEKKENKLYFLQENVPEWVKIYLLDKINY